MYDQVQFVCLFDDGLVSFDECFIGVDFYGVGGDFCEVFGCEQVMLVFVDELDERQFEVEFYEFF